jgi:hypothetical protein
VTRRDAHINTTRSTGGVTRHGGDWVRTPTFHLEGRAGKWADSGYRSRVDATTCVEVLLMFYALGAFALAWTKGEHWMSASSLLCVAAFGTMGGLGRLRGRRSRRLAAAGVAASERAAVTACARDGVAATAGCRPE